MSACCLTALIIRSLCDIIAPNFGISAENSLFNLVLQQHNVAFSMLCCIVLWLVLVCWYRKYGAKSYMFCGNQTGIRMTLSVRS